MLSRMLSTRILFTVSASGFTARELLCAPGELDQRDDRLAGLPGFHRRRHDPDGVCRLLHDLSGQTSAPIITPLIGLIATLAPTIGPTVGGYLTELFSWHWLFLINVVPGIMVAIARLVPHRLRQARLVAGRKRLTGAALAAMAVFLGTAEYVLEEGPANDWFDDAAVFAIRQSPLVIGMILFFWRTFTPRTADRRSVPPSATAISRPARSSPS